MSDRIAAFSELVRDNLLEVGAGRPRSVSLDQYPLPILRVADVLEGRIQSPPSTPRMDIDPQKLGPKTSKAGDVVLTVKGTVGRVAVVPPDGPTWAYSPQLCYFRPDANGPLNARYLYYWFNSNEFWEQADALKGQTDMADFLSLSDVHALKIRLPSLKVQEAVAVLLGSFDDKIAANARVTSLAEELLRAIAGTSPTWTTVGALARQSTVVSSPESLPDIVSHYSLPAFDAGRVPEIGSGRLIKSSKFVIRTPSVLVSKLNPRIPRVWDVCAAPDTPAVASTEFVVLQPTTVPTTALWAAVSQPDVSAELASKVSGTSGSHQRVKPAEVLALPIRDPRALPDRDLQQLVSLGQLILSRRLESVQLAAMRDQLLPLLMSGTVPLRGAQKVVEGVA